MKKIKLLYAPYNIASMPAITVDILNELGNIEAKGVCIDTNRFLNFGKSKDKCWKVFDVYSNLRNPIRFLYNLILSEYFLVKRILWCDAIIWQWDAKVYLPHYIMMRILNKPILVEWVGSDIRIPEIVFQHSSYYLKEYENGNYTYTNESKERSQSIQKKFKKLNAIPMLCPEMSLFLDHHLFPEFYKVFQRINLDAFKVNYPSIYNSVPVIVHTPTATGGKGTRFVRIAIENLKLRYRFQYLEIINKTRQESLDTIFKADLFLDQFLAGAYGMASCEAMAMGKPVFCFLLDPLVALLPEDCPIVNVSVEELESGIARFLENPELRNKTGQQSRKYVEKYHDALTICKDLNHKIIELVNG